MAIVEIDKDSGFCFGVVTAINKAEAELEKSGKLYCLGDIVHNSDEVERLGNKGLISINHEQLKTLHNVKVLLRAHGEPPETYKIAKENNIEIIDATCPVVLQLQKKIKNSFDNPDSPNQQIVIYGKLGHAEVNGLVGQTDGKALVIEHESDIDRIDYSRSIALYSQTTKSVDGFAHIVQEISKRKVDAGFKSYDTICRQVANRIPKIRQFALAHDLILFVCGEKSSNGKVLFEECKSVNENSHFVTDTSKIDCEWLAGKESIGICGATSTPLWLMTAVKDYVAKMLDKQLSDK